MHGKRYRESAGFGRGRDRKIGLRIFITVCGAVIFAVAFCYFGIVLGKKADAGVSQETTTADAEITEESEKETDAPFDFKDIEGRKTACSEVALKDAAIYDTVLVRLTDKDGKLKFLSGVSSLIYGSQFSTTLKPIAAGVNDANLKANAVAVSFSPFKADSASGKNGDYAETCTLMLIKELCDQEICEILIEGHELSDELISGAVKYVHSRDGVRLGVMLPSDIFEKMEYEQEEILRKYYTAFDFCVMDFSNIPLMGASQTETGEETESAYAKLYSMITENSLIIAKYSLRLRFCAPTVEALEEANRLIYELGIENYEIVAE